MSESQLLVTSVPRTLEAKSKIFGFELGDVLMLFLNLSIQNLIFGATSFKYLMVYGSTTLFGFVLFFVKRGKPDSYLQHLSQFIISPTVFFSGATDHKFKPVKMKREILC
jgi:hypothetical protein